MGLRYVLVVVRAVVADRQLGTVGSLFCLHPPSSISKISPDASRRLNPSRLHSSRGRRVGAISGIGCLGDDVTRDL